MDYQEFMDAFKAALKERGLRITGQREAIVASFFETGGHLSLNSLLEIAKRRQASVGFATVYRTMKLLVECGLALEHDFAQGQKYYELRRGRGHHDHLICIGCGTIAEFEDEIIEAAQLAVAERHGFLLVEHRHEMFGRCVECQQVNEAVET